MHSKQRPVTSIIAALDIEKIRPRRQTVTANLAYGIIGANDFDFRPF